MNQSELVDKVAQAATLNQAAAAKAVKAVVTTILESLAAGEPVRVSGLGTFNVAERAARLGRNPQTGESIKIPASKAVRFHAGKTVKVALNPPRIVDNKKSARPKRSVATR
jgi:DNA-binding protein HU-beta